ncbi:hypothetical protein BGX28_005418 [Mortierella sp. GBA30]|nr:hypothetical protein BGX28_005418 [Mortierella sp. GBA30]
MSLLNATIIAIGQGSAKITFYDNEHNPTDSEPLKTSSDSVHVYSVAFFRNIVKKYGFSLENKGFKNLFVSYGDNTYDLTKGANTVGFDFWNTKIFTPSKVDASYTQAVGGVVYVERY